MPTNLVEPSTRYLSPAEAAELFGVKRATTYRHVHRGTLPAVRLGASIRIPADELTATLEGTRTGPGERAARVNPTDLARDRWKPYRQAQERVAALEARQHGGKASA